MSEHATDALKLAAGDAEAAAFIENELLKSLRSELPQSHNSSLVLTLRDEADSVVGGLTASTSYGWLLVKVLWVSDAYRGRGFGRKLLEAAERKAIGSHCHSAWLDTSNPKAMQFYLSMGYVSFGQLSNTQDQDPAGHTRWFMQKQLDGDDSNAELA